MRGRRQMRLFTIVAGVAISTASALADRPSAARCRNVEPAVGQEHRLTDVERATLQTITEVSKENAYVAALMVKYQIGPNALVDRLEGTIKPLSRCLDSVKQENREPEPFRKRL